MTVLTMERFDALGVGEKVTTGHGTRERRVWNRTAEGWQEDGTEIVLPREWFAGEVADGRVMQGVEPDLGQLWRSASDNAYHYILVGQHNSNWRALRVRTYGDFNQASYTRVETLTPAQVTHDKTVVTERPVWYQPYYEMGVALDSVLRDLESVRQSYTDLTTSTRADTVKVRNTEAVLHDFMLKHDMGPDSDLADVLAGIGYNRPPESTTVKVTVAGQSYVTPSVEDISRLLPEGTTATGSQRNTLASWEMILPVKTFVRDDGYCPCRHVTRTQVQDALIKAGHTTLYTFSGTITCGFENHSNVYV